LNPSHFTKQRVSKPFQIELEETVHKCMTSYSTHNSGEKKKQIDELDESTPYSSPQLVSDRSDRSWSATQLTSHSTSE